MVQVLVLYSPFETIQQVQQRWDGWLTGLLRHADDEILAGGYWNAPQALQARLSAPGASPQAVILIMGSGGTERLAQLVAATYRKPVLLVCDGRKNSLAAALEVYSVLRDEHPCWLLYADDHPKTMTQTLDIVKAVKALENINQARLGVIGGPSSWLLTSDQVTHFGQFTTTLVPIAMESLLEEYRQAATDQAEALANTWHQEYGAIGVNQQSLVDSSRAHLAMQQIISSHQLDGLTIRCFELLPHHFTACMGMSMCADQGLVATCEGDLVAMFTMLLARELSGQPVWMANPSALDLKNNTITFAHCTLPSTMLEDKKHSTLTTHMESGLSTAISGPMQLRDVTILRSGPRFDTLQVSTGKIINGHLQHPDLCRTQAVVRLDLQLDNWLDQAQGNHQIIVYGNLRPQLEVFCRLTGLNLLS